jgi:hypothetical protein
MKEMFPPVGNLIALRGGSVPMPFDLLEILLCMAEIDTSLKDLSLRGLTSKFTKSKDF